jgi:hypothetical protein
MGISGTRVSNPNFQLRFFAICFMGIAAFASVLWWRQQVLVNAEYVDVPGRGSKGRDISQEIISNN